MRHEATRLGVLLLLLLSGVARADFSGRVVGPDGAPLAGADVWLRTLQQPTFGIMSWGHATTDAAGRFDYATADLGSDAWIVSGNLSTVPQHFVAGTPVELHAAPGHRRRGQVIDRAGQPVAGARVAVTFLVPIDLTSGYEPPSVVSDAAGWYELRCLPASAQASLVAHKPGYDDARGQVEPDGWAPTLVLVPAARPAVPSGIRGRLLRGDQPLAHTRVRAYRGTDDGESTTESDGTFTLPGLAPGQWTLTAHPQPPYDEWIVTKAAGVNVAAGAMTETTVRLEPGGVITGRVTQPDGQPAPFALVETRQGEKWHCVHAAADGSFRLVTAVGQVVLTCGGWNQLVEARAAPAPPTVVALTARMQPPLTGRVTLPDDTPVAGAFVQAEHFAQHTMTGPDGTYRLLVETHAEEPELEVTWVAPDGQVWEAETAAREWPDGGVPPPPRRIVLRALGRPPVAMAITSRGGRPLAGVLVGASDPSHDAPERGFLQVQTWHLSDAAGVCALRGIDGNTRQRLVLLKPGWRATGPITLSAGKAHGAVMEPLDGRVAGRVVDAQGRGVAGAQLLAADCPPDSDSVTAADGSFELAVPLSPGRRRVAAMQGERMLAQALVAAGTRDVTLLLAEYRLPDDASRRRAAMSALAQALAGASPAQRVRVLPTALEIEPETALAWIDRVEEVTERRREWAAGLAALGRANAERALQLLPEVAQAPEAELRCRAVGGLVAALRQPVPPAARAAVDRELEALGPPLGVGGGRGPWIGLIPALARLDDPRARPALTAWLDGQPDPRQARELALALWEWPELAQLVLPATAAPAEMAVRIALRLAHRDGAAALDWFRHSKPALGHEDGALPPAAELAVALADVNPDEAFALAERLCPGATPDLGLRDRVAAALTDPAAALERFRHRRPGAPASGALARAAQRLVPAWGESCLVSVRAGVRLPQDDADLAALAPNLARLDLELAAARASCVPLERSRPLGESPHGQLLAAFCALDPERAVDLAGSELVAPDDRLERLLFVARTLGALEP